jgi:hypothetical protein
MNPYRGFFILREGTKYKVRGSKRQFDTVKSAKEYVDMVQDSLNSTGPKLVDIRPAFYSSTDKQLSK